MAKEKENTPFRHPTRRKSQKDSEPTAEVVSQRHENYRAKLTAILHGVYLFDGQLNSIIGEKFGFSKQLSALHNANDFDKFEESFYAELRLRLNFVVEDHDNEENRCNLFSFLVVFAYRLLKCHKDKLFKFLIEYCEKLNYCSDTVVRRNICFMVGIFLRYCQSAFFEDLTDVEKEKKIIISKARNTLYEIIIERLYDKEPTVRCEVYKAMAPLQQVCISNEFKLAIDKSPKEIILAGLCDLDARCRLVALQCIDMRVDDPAYAVVVTDVAIGESSTRTRKEAILQLSKLNPKQISADQLTVLLHSNLTALDDSLRLFTKEKLISVWLSSIARKVSKRSGSSSSDDDADQTTGLGAALMILMARLNWDQYPEEMSKVCLSAIEVVHRLISEKKSFTLSETVKALAEDHTQPHLLTRLNRRELVDPKQTVTNMALKAFLWRCFIQYCVEQTGKEHSKSGRIDEAERSNCLTRLAPTLHDMCLLIEDLLKFESERLPEISLDPVPVKEEQYREMALLDCLKICSFLEEEAAGMDKYKALLEKFLVDINQPQTVKLHIGQVLVDTFYMDAPIDALIGAMNRLSEAAHREMDPDATTLNETVSLTTNADRAPSPTPDLSEDLVVHTIEVILSLLKTGRFKRMHPYMQNIYNNMVPQCFRLSRARKYGIETTAIMCSIDLGMAMRCFPLLWSAAKQNEDLQAAVSSMDGVCDLIAEYSYEQANKWAGDDDIAQFFREKLTDENTEEQIYAKAFECAAKILIVQRRDFKDDSWAELLEAMLCRVFTSKISLSPKLKSCANQFFILFTSMSISNQKILCNAFSNILFGAHEATADDNPFLYSLNFERVATIVLELTRYSRVSSTRKPSESPSSNKENEPNAKTGDSCAHEIFGQSLIAGINGVMANSRLMKLHCRILSNLDFDRIQTATIDTWIKSLNEIIHTDDTMDSVVQEFSKLIKKFNNAKKIAEKMEPKKGGALSVKTPATRRKGCKAAILKDGNMFLTPKADPSTPTAEVKTRVRLPRTAKGRVKYEE